MSRKQLRCENCGRTLRTHALYFKNFGETGELRCTIREPPWAILKEPITLWKPQQEAK